MGIISILIGIIVFACFTGAGAFIAAKVVDLKNEIAQSIVDLANYSNFWITVLIIFIFAFIGLLIGMNFIMHGCTYRRKSTRNSSLCIISILLGVIALCCFMLVGFFIPSFIIQYKSTLSMFGALSFLNSTSDGLISLVFLGSFTVIGLLICLNMTMHGLIYRKVGKLQYTIKRK